MQQLPHVKKLAFFYWLLHNCKINNSNILLLILKHNLSKKINDGWVDGIHINCIQLDVYISIAKDHVLVLFLGQNPTIRSIKFVLRNIFFFIFCLSTPLQLS